MHECKSIKKAAGLRGKTAIVRVDFNEPFEHGRVSDSFRIKSAVATIKYLKRAGARIALITHFEDTRAGRPVSIRPFIRQFSRLVGEKLVFVSAYEKSAVASGLKKGIVILENVRLEKGEEKNSAAFARTLASLADIYVNEAFSVSHRKHASIVGVARFMPSYAGITFIKEIESLGIALSPKHPFLLVVGGAKFKTKFALLKRFVRKADAIFLGGVLANTFFAALGFPVGKSVYEKSAIPDIKKHFLSARNIVLPFDVRTFGGGNKFAALVGKQEKICDIGDESALALADLARGAKLVVWNGPLGYMERGCHKNTFALLRALARARGKVILGGGDTLAALDELGIHNKYYHVSTGGGAMLDFLADGSLPGIRALEGKRV